MLYAYIFMQRESVIALSGSGHLLLRVCTHSDIIYRTNKRGEDDWLAVLPLC